MSTRPAVLAGSGWYPGSEAACRREIEAFAASSPGAPADSFAGVGGIVPHAGWACSGELACAVFKSLGAKRSPDVMVIFGTHMIDTGAVAGIELCDRWDTPLGAIEVATDLAGALLKDSDLVREEGGGMMDNTIEVQAPFVKHFFPDARLLAISAPPNADVIIALARRIRELAAAGGTSLCSIGSTDLMHYGPNYGFSPAGRGPRALEWAGEEDGRVIERMAAMDIEGTIDEALSCQNACCPGAAAAGIALAGELGATEGRLLARRSSHDVFPDASFVGYCALLF